MLFALFFGYGGNYFQCPASEWCDVQNGNTPIIPIKINENKVNPNDVTVNGVIRPAM